MLVCHCNEVPATKLSCSASSKSLLLQLSVFLLLAPHMCCQERPRPPTVLTSRGMVEGFVWGQSEAFLGIPFAEAPVGDRRFLPAVLKSPWGPQTLPAHSFAKACWQGDDNATLYSEDCLYLNLWRPLHTVQTAKLPVLVFIHGGAFSGGGVWVQDSVQLGDVLSVSQHVIVVTLAYRLGFLALKELVRVSGGASGGMNGVLDQIAALRFLQQELEAFGGDPAKVTVVGESAGGQSVTALLVSPQARGLFRAAVIESGAAAYSPLWRFGSYSEGLNRGKLFMAFHKCSSLRCLRRIPAKNMYWHSGGGAAFPKSVRVWFRDFLWTEAWVDGGVLPKNETVGTLLQDVQNVNAKYLLLGANSADGMTIYAPFDWLPPFWSNSTVLYRLSMALWWNWVNKLPGWFPSSHVLQHYPLSSEQIGGNALAAFVEADGDNTVTCPTLELARAASKVGLPTYLYMYSYNSPADTSRSSNWGGVPVTFASHGSELPMVFGRPGDGVVFDRSDFALSRSMQSLWGAFVRTGDPNDLNWAGSSGAKLLWPRFAGEQGKHLLFERAGPRVASDFRCARCNFWKPYLRG